MEVKFVDALAILLGLVFLGVTAECFSAQENKAYRRRESAEVDAMRVRGELSRKTHEDDEIENMVRQFQEQEDIDDDNELTDIIFAEVRLAREKIGAHIGAGEDIVETVGSMSYMTRMFRLGKKASIDYEIKAALGSLIK